MSEFLFYFVAACIVQLVAFFLLVFIVALSMHNEFG